MTMRISEIPSEERQQSFLSRHWQKLVAAGIWLAIIGSVVGYGLVTGKSATDISTDLIELFLTPYGALLYIVLYTLRPIAFFPATLITIAAGSIFGAFWGLVYTIVGSNLSSTLAYFLGRILGKGIIDESKSTGIIANYAGRMRRNSFETILTMRLIFMPYDLVTYLAGFLHVPYRPFILATILGSLPGTITIVLAGASFQITDVLAGNVEAQLNVWTLAFSGVMLIAGIAISKYLKQREAKRVNKAV